MYGIIDCDNCYVSCERVFRPDLKDKPVVVLSNNDGCVVARSNEAKKMGIKAGTPYFQLAEQFPNQKIVVFSSNYELYGELTSRVVSIISKEAPAYFRYSIDECFVYLDGMEHLDLKAWGEELHKKIKRNVGMPVSIGLAPNKTLAKMASHFAKKYQGYRHCCMIDSNEKRIKAQLGKVYESIIELESKNIDFALKDGNGNEQIERLDTAPIVEKMMSVFRVNKNADKNVQKLAVAQKIIESRLPDRLVVSESANALTYLEKIFGQKIEIMLQDKKDYLTASRTPTFDYDIALSRIKSKSNYGKLAIRKAIVQYLMQLDNPQSTHIPLDVDLSASGVQIVLGGLEKTEIEREILQGYNSSVLEVHDREKSRLLPAVFREENVSVTFPFLNLTTEIELKQLFARKPNLKIK